MPLGAYIIAHRYPMMTRGPIYVTISMPSQGISSYFCLMAFISV